MTTPPLSFSPTKLSSGPFGWSLTVPAQADRGQLADALHTQLEELQVQDHPGAHTIQVWLEHAQDGDNELLKPLGLTPYRDLWQLRRALPAEASGITTRAFNTTTDLDDFIRVNSRAFHWHPEQGQLSATDVQRTMADEPWFDAEGFRLLEMEGQLAGFCWTKVHPHEDPPVGEIYAIAIDPDFHGRGLGGPMTLAGLEHLSKQGLTVANLYVESDNHAAVKTYDRLGFSHFSTNRAYQTTSGPQTNPTSETTERSS